MCVSGLAIAEATPESALSVNQQVMADQAKTYYDQNNFVAALPLFEQLASEFPNNIEFAERLAGCLMVTFENLPPGKEKNATIARTKFFAERARSLGDTSNYLQVVLDAVNSDTAKADKGYAARLREAEQAFSRGDLDAALAGYIEVAESDPRLV